MFTDKHKSASKSFFEILIGLFKALKENFSARLASPPLHGINLIQDEIYPSTSEDQPGFGIIDEIKPMK